MTCRVACVMYMYTEPICEQHNKTVSFKNVLSIGLATVHNTFSTHVIVAATSEPNAITLLINVNGSFIKSVF